MTQSVDNTAAEIPGVIRDPITAANLLRVNADGSINVTGGTAAKTLSMKISKFATPGTASFTVTVGMVYCIVEAVGSGAGAGGVAAPGVTAGASSGGAGAGSYARAALSAAAVGASQTVTIGAKGVGGAAGNHDGTDGADCSFGSLVIGKGGTHSAASTGGNFSAGGAGGVAGTGDFTIVGGKGGDGVDAGIASIRILGGIGGQAPVFGTGTASASGAASGGAGVAGTAPGDGGAGAGATGNSNNEAGGDGFPGIVVVTEYIFT